MAASSQYFEILLGSKFKEGKEDDVTLEGIDGPTLKLIIQFCYTGDIEINEENIDDVILAASSMELLLLEKKCADFWAKRLRFENWVDIYMKADKYTLSELKRKIFQLICESFERVPVDDLARVDQFFFRDVLKYEKIQVPEQILFTRLMQWIAHEPNEREKNVVEFIKFIRLEHLPGQVNPFLSKFFQIQVSIFVCHRPINMFRGCFLFSFAVFERNRRAILLEVRMPRFDSKRISKTCTRHRNGVSATVSHTQEYLLCVLRDDGVK